MIYTKLTNKALKYSFDKHKDQFDKGGIPYIFHPYAVAEMMDDEVTTCAALLHDVIEDSDTTLEDLKKEFPFEVVNLVDLLTHRENEDYFDYIRKIKINPKAIKIKLADLAHNSNDARFEGSNCFSENELIKRHQKYDKARSLLEAQ